MRALYGLDANKDHVLRAGFARAFRAPGPMMREFRMQGLSGLFNIVDGTERVENETSYAFEAGYFGRFSKNLMFRVDTYYQRLDHILGIGQYHGRACCECRDEECRWG